MPPISSPVSTVSARTAWYYDFPFGAHTQKKKRNSCIFRVSRLTQAGLNSRITESEGNKCKNIENVCMLGGCVLHFAEYLQGTNTCSSVSMSLMILKLCRLTGKCFEETLRGGKDVKNLARNILNEHKTSPKESETAVYGYSPICFEFFRCRVDLLQS